MWFPNNRGILADHEIDLLCRATHRIEVFNPGSGIVVEVTDIVSSDDEAQRQLDKKLGQYTSTTVGLTSIGVNAAYQARLISLDESNFKPMISPFVAGQVRTKYDITDVKAEGQTLVCDTEPRKIISYGLSSFGYDFRVADEFKVFTNINSTLVDPLNFDDNSFVTIKDQGYCIVPPNSFVLARTMEKFAIPEDVVGVCTGKSTIARSGLSIMVTPLEPGWEGYLTLEYANTTPLPVKLYAGMGGGQIMFYRGSKPNVTYADRNGKYQGQGEEVVPPRV